MVGSAQSRQFGRPAIVAAAFPCDRLAIIAGSKAGGDAVTVIVSVAKMNQEIIPGIISECNLISGRRLKGNLALKVGKEIRPVFIQEFHHPIYIRTPSGNPEPDLIVDERLFYIQAGRDGS